MAQYSPKTPPLGQHFLNSPHVIEKILEVAQLTPSDTVLEIGPGKGILTFALARTVKHVIAVEYDKALLEALQYETRAQGISNITFVEADIRTFDPRAHGLAEHSYHIVANIPYYLTGTLLETILSSYPSPHHIVLMVQKEVATRIVARDHKESILSLSVKAYGVPRLAFTVSKGNFSPPPKIDSAVLEITPHPPLDMDYVHFFKLIKAGFSAKRQTLENTLARGLGKDKKEIALLLQETGVTPKIRAEDLSLENWRVLTNAAKDLLETPHS